MCPDQSLEEVGEVLTMLQTMELRLNSWSAIALRNRSLKAQHPQRDRPFLLVVILNSDSPSKQTVPTWHTCRSTVCRNGSTLNEGSSLWLKRLRYLWN